MAQYKIKEYKTTESQRAYMARQRADPEYRAKQKEYMKAYTKENKEQIKAQNKTYYDANARDICLAHRGITKKIYDEMLAKQGGVCAICKGPQRGRWKSFDVDHSHLTGEIRGLLCGLCNKAIGLLRDDVQLLNAAITYLKEHDTMTTTKYTAEGRTQRLAEIAEQMKTATAKQKEELSLELNKVIGFDEGTHDPERLAIWELTHGGREP